ncbi:L,D-transpeptidase [Bacillus thuringiensis]|nr:L,D-transpeptidase [Bacillus thuringiensis]
MGLWIDVSKSKHKLALYDGSILIKTYPIAVGKMLTPTPSGKYKIINKDEHPPDVYGPIWMGLSKPTYGVHGTNDSASIGRNMSHGCIRMYNEDILELSSRVPLDTPINIHE